jgi:predicted dehydrogenase
MINVGLIGTGYIGPIHLDALSRIEGISIKAVCDINESLAEMTAKKYNVPKWCSNHMDIINDDDIHVIHNCATNRFHYGITKAALEREKHVLSEKPLAMNLKEAGELVDLAEKKGLVTGVDFCYRYYPVVQETAVRIKKGDLGKVRIVAGTYFQDWLSNTTDYSWRLEKSESGDSNITADLGSHWFDLVQFTTGLKITDVLADFSTIIPVRKKPKRQVLAFEKVGKEDTEDFKVEVEDYSAILFRLSNGAPGSFITSQTCAGRKSDTEFQIYGDKCSLAWNHKRSNELWIGYREKPNEILIENPILQDPSTSKFATLPAGHPMGYLDAILNLFEDFYGVIKTKKETTPVSRPVFQTGYNEMIILEAALKSAKSRQWVEVKW